MHVSSTEPLALRSLGHSSTLPEKYGVDFLWWRHDHNGRLTAGWCGVQRKEAKDFVASLHDGRLARELHQMEPLVHAMVVIEGRVDHVGETVVAGRRAVPVVLWDAACWAIQDRGVKMGWTVNVDDTAKTVSRFQRWTEKAEHTTLNRTRSPAPTANWGKTGSRAFQIHLLTGLPGVGEKLASAIVNRFGGLPWRWTVGEKELTTVPGIGKERARRMIEALEGGVGDGRQPV